MKDFSVSLVLVDFIPVIFFAAASVFLMRDLYNKMSKEAFALFAAGTINIICARALKALYKPLYAAGICDFDALNTMFFLVQSIGFLLAGIGILALISRRQGKNAVLAVAPSVFPGTFVFVCLMAAGLGLMDARLCIISAKIKKDAADRAVCPVLCMLLVYGMSIVAGFCPGFDGLDRGGSQCNRPGNVSCRSAVSAEKWVGRVSAERRGRLIAVYSGCYTQMNKKQCISSAPAGSVQAVGCLFCFLKT